MNPEQLETMDYLASTDETNRRLLAYLALEIGYAKIEFPEREFGEMTQKIPQERE